MTGLLQVVVASVRAVLTMAGLLFGVAVLAGAAAGDLPVALTAAGWGVLIGVSGLWAHEAAHLIMARRLAGAAAAEVVRSGSTLAVRAPELTPGQAVAVAVAGPVVGAAASLGWTPVAPLWIAGGFALVHAANLVPVAGTDGALAWRACCRLLDRRWTAKRGVTGGQ
ncbi:MAG: hypothetical protein IPL41_09970 [Micropruina sp.]|nr:hypothetical protein [Micropruina sp.]